MADKTIGSLKKAASLQDDSLFIMEQQGEAMSLAGEQIREFAEDAGREGAATLKKGATFTPYLRVDGDKVMLGFNNDAGLENPDEQDVKGPAGGVNSFNGRQGAVFSLAGDYTIEQITGLSDALAAIDKALANKAPAGYGLGGDYQLIADADDAIVDGKYGTQGSTVNLPASGDFGILEVTARRNDKFIHQTFYVGSYSFVGYKAERDYYNGIWSAWEWIDPPMLPGVEYRTTERYLGKPVYVKAVDFSGLPNNTTKEVAVSTPNKDVTVRYFVSSSSSHVHPSKFVSEFYFSNSAMKITTNADASIFATKVTVFYTKTTD